MKHLLFPSFFWILCIEKPKEQHSIFVLLELFCPFFSKAE